MEEILVQIENDIKNCNNQKLRSVEEQLIRFRKESVSNLASSIIDFGIQAIKNEIANRV